MNQPGRISIGILLVLGFTALAIFLAATASIGADDRASVQVGALTGGAYEPWIESREIPGGEQNEPLLFGVQAGIGLAVLAGCFWYWREHRSGA